MVGKKQEGENRGNTDKTLSISLLLLLSSLLIASIYLSVKYLINLKSVAKDERSAGKTDTVSGDSTLITYVDDTYGYSLKYSPLLVPREAETSPYLRFVVFFASKGTYESGFAISVREKELDEEVSLIKEEIQEDVEGKLTREDRIVKDGYPGVRLEYQPEKAEEAEPRVVVILNNGKYSYTISAHPSQIDRVFSTFKFLE